MESISKRCKVDADNDNTIIGRKTMARMDYSAREPTQWPIDCLMIDTGVLTVKNPFENNMDGRIIFISDNDMHDYYVDGIKYPFSATSLASVACEQFMKYTIATNCSKKSRNKDYMNKTALEILAIWENSARIGTKMHAAIEVFFNSGVITKDPEVSVEMLYFRDFVKNELEPRGLECYRTEPIIFTEPSSGFKTAGSVDFIGIDKNGDYWILDWKRTLHLNSIEPEHYTKMMNAPLEHLHSTDYNKYSLQLHIYRYILAKYYNIHVKAENMALVAFHPSNKTYKFIHTANLEDEVVMLFEDFNFVLTTLERKKKELDMDKELFYDKYPEAK